MYGILDNNKLIGQFAAPLSVRSNHPIFVSDTLSLKRHASRRVAQRWEIETNIVPLSGDANDFFAYMVTKGNTETVDVRMPQNYGVISKRSAGGIAQASGAKGATVVSIGGMVGYLPRGTFIRFSNHSKIYMTTTPFSSSSHTTLGVYPSLRVSVSSTTFNYQDDVIMNSLFDTDTVIGMSYTDGILQDNGTIKLIERI